MLMLKSAGHQSVIAVFQIESSKELHFYV